MLIIRNVILFFQGIVVVDNRVIIKQCGVGVTTKVNSKYRNNSLLLYEKRN